MFVPMLALGVHPRYNVLHAGPEPLKLIQAIVTLKFKEHKCRDFEVPEKTLHHLMISQDVELIIV